VSRVNTHHNGRYGLVVTGACGDLPRPRGRGPTRAEGRLRSLLESLHRQPPRRKNSFGLSPAGRRWQGLPSLQTAGSRYGAGSGGAAAGWTARGLPRPAGTACVRPGRAR
jgi:hypothetical protein